MTGVYEGGLVHDYAKTRRKLIGDDKMDRIIDLERRLTLSETHFRQHIAKLENDIKVLQSEVQRHSNIVSKYFHVPAQREKLLIETVSIRKIISFVCKKENVLPMDVISNRRDKDAMHVRYIIYYLSRHLTRLSTMSIGSFLGGRDHTTILAGYRKSVRMVDSDPDFREKVSLYKEILLDKICELPGENPVSVQSRLPSAEMVA